MGSHPLSQEKATRKNVQNLGLYSVIFEEELQKQGFALDWMLSGIVDNSVIRFLKFDTEGETRVRMKLWLVERHSLAQREGCLMFLGQCSCFVCV